MVVDPKISEYMRHLNKMRVNKKGGFKDKEKARAAQRKAVESRKRNKLGSGAEG